MHAFPSGGMLVGWQFKFLHVQELQDLVRWNIGDYRDQVLNRQLE